MTQREPKIVLASASPRRKELLAQIGLNFEVIVSETDETVPKEWQPWKVVEELSARKAMAVFQGLTKKRIVVGADTVVALEDQILGKPGTIEKTIEMLKMLRGKKHTVYTGVTILMPAENKEGFVKKTFHEATNVKVSVMSDQEILEYAETKDPLDKAGAYGIQGCFARYIQGIEGDYNNVVGLPAGRVYRELECMKRRNAAKKAVIFDLDGTLSDSIGSMKYSGNACLQELGLPTFGEKEYQYFVGDGAANLVRRMLKAAGDAKLQYFDKAYERYKEIFAVHCMDGVKPYEGIPELLQMLKKQGIRLAVLSNKPHAESVKVVETLFGEGMFDLIQGQEEGIPIKPDPSGVFRILERMREKFGMEIKPENLLYLGDTGTDMRTGRSAGAYTIGVLWGFRQADELLENGADELINKPSEIVECMKEVSYERI